MLLFWLWASVSGCKKDDGHQTQPQPEESSSDLATTIGFQPDQLMVVEATLPESSWQELSRQTRSLFALLIEEECFSHPLESVFTWFEGDVLVNGESLQSVGFRKKGFIGSLSWTRPSLKIDSDRFVDDQRFSNDVEHITLNNSNQDPSRIHSCMAYDYFRAAGVLASRCSHATVEVNGADLGVFANVEPLKKAFLRENFGNDDGELFEGAASEFTSTQVATFDIKTDGASLAPLEELTEILTHDDSVMWDELNEVLDVPSYIRFWAAESIIGHWDGYNLGNNNYYVYHNPTDGKLVFIPWGADAVMEDPDSEALFLNGLVGAHLWNTPQGREAILTELERQLDEVFVKEHLLSEVDRMTTLIEPHLLKPDAAHEIQDEVRTFIKKRTKVVRAFIDEQHGDTDTSSEPLQCLEVIGDLTASFDTVWNDMENLFDYSSTLEGQVEGESFPNALHGAGAAFDADAGGNLIVALSATLTFSSYAQVVLVVPEDVEPGTYPIDVGAITGIAIVGAGEEEEWYLLGGTVTFDELSFVDGAAISGSLSAEIIPFIFDQP